MNDYKLLIFDWDGTLMDSISFIVECIHRTIDDLKLEERSDEQVRNIIGLGLSEAVTTLFPGRDAEFERRFVDGYRAHYLRPGPSPTPLFPGAGETVRALADQGYQLAVATGKGRRGLDKVLAESGLGELFRITRCSDETRSKPHPQMLHEILAATGVTAGAALMIGDSEYDLEMARRAGMPSLGVSYGVHPCERLAAHRPRGCIDCITELPRWLDGGATAVA